MEPDNETNVDATPVKEVLEDGGVEPGVSLEAVKKPRKRDREKYNAYQRQYMRMYRKRKNHG